MFIANALSKKIIFTGQLLLFLGTALCKVQDVKFWDLHLPNMTLFVNKSDEVSKETSKITYSPFLQPSWTGLKKSRRRHIDACWNSFFWQKNAIAAQFMSLKMRSINIQITWTRAMTLPTSWSRSGKGEYWWQCKEYPRYPSIFQFSSDIVWSFLCLNGNKLM